MVETRHFPEPGCCSKYVGASVILTATAMDSDESIIWPYITSQCRHGPLLGDARRLEPQGPAGDVQVQGTQR